MPSRLVKQDHGVGAGRDRLRDLGQVQAHALGRAAGQDETGALAFAWADRAEDVGGLRALILGRRGPGAALRPAAGDRVLLPHPGLVTKPGLYRFAAGLVLGDRRQTGGEVFLKAATAASFLAWWRGRAE